jgi:hypothetical protein
LITLTPLRTLEIQAPSQPGRPAHVSAASGLVRAGAYLYTVADDENHIGIFPAEGQAAGVLHRIAEGELPLAKEPRKKRKPDFESIVRLDGALLALGSCSRPNRCVGVVVALRSNGGLGESRRVDLTPLREALESRFGRPNIEGAVVMGDELVLLQRGNKGDKRNARIRLRRDRMMAAIASTGAIGAEAIVDIHEHELGDVDGVPLCFSDGASLPGGRMVFSAIAEDTGDGYADGACSGSGIGVLDRSGRLERFEPIAAGHKVEGIEVVGEGGGTRLLLVTDADDADVPATLFEAAWPA